MAKTKITYKEAMEELTDIVESIENNQLEMDQLAEKTKRATELIKYCKGMIIQTSEEVEKVLEEGNS